MIENSFVLFCFLINFQSIWEMWINLPPLQLTFLNMLRGACQRELVNPPLTCNFQPYIISPVTYACLNHTLNCSIFQFTDILNYQSRHFFFVEIKTIVTYYCYSGYYYNLSSIQLPSSWYHQFTSSQCIVPLQCHIGTSIQHWILDCSYVICARRGPGWWRSRPSERFSLKLKKNNSCFINWLF